MLHYTVIARIVDGLPLAASVDQNPSMAMGGAMGGSSAVDLRLATGGNDALAAELKRQAKFLLKRFTPLAGGQAIDSTRGSVDGLVDGRLLFQ